MKKKLIAAAVMAALTVSTASVFAAAPTFSGDTNIEFNKLSNSDDSLTSRIRLNVNTELGDGFYAHARARMDHDLKTGEGSEHGVTFDRAYIGYKANENFDVKVGKQSLWMGKGMLMDAELSAVNATTSIEGIKLAGFYGNNDSKHQTGIEASTAIGNVNLGAAYLKGLDNAVINNDKYFALNADTKISDKAVFNLEYVKADQAKADGYLAEVKFGNAAVKGDLDYSLMYYDVEDGALPTTTTNGNYDGAKGFKVKANYKVTDNATLTAYHDMGEAKIGGADHKRTNVEFAINF